MTVRQSTLLTPLSLVQEPERIIVFRALHLGDFLCAVPALRALRARYPHAEVTFIGLPWNESIIRRFPYVDHFLPFPGFAGLEDVPWDERRTVAFWQRARSRDYDLAIQMHGDGRLSNLFVVELGGKVTLGYRPSGSDLPGRLSLELEDEGGQHEIFRWLRLVEMLGATGTSDLEFPLLPEDREELMRVSQEVAMDLGRPIIVIHPGGKDKEKRWPPERFAAVADQLAGSLTAQIAITGGVEEQDLAHSVAGLMKTTPFLLAGMTSIGSLASLLHRATLLLANDTGPSHLAVALATPSITLFGPTDPTRWGPLNPRTHRVIWSGKGRSISSIHEERVIQESLALVELCIDRMY